MKAGIRHVLVSQSKTEYEYTYHIVLEKLRETEANTRYAKQYCPNLFVDRGVMIYTGDTFAHCTN